MFKVHVYESTFRMDLFQGEDEGWRCSKMSPCEFNQEGFCILQAEYSDVEKCSSAKGKLQKCTAKESDLIELCSDCEEPTSQCGCGTCWVMVTDKTGKIVAVTPKDLAKLQGHNGSGK